MVATHTVHTDIYQMQLCNRMKRRTIKTSASMAAGVRHTYFFVSLCEIRYLLEIFDITGRRRDLVDGTVRPCRWLQWDDQMLFRIDTGIESGKLRKIRKIKSEISRKKIIYFNIEHLLIESLFNNNQRTIECFVCHKLRKCIINIILSM